MKLNPTVRLPENLIQHLLVCLKWNKSCSLCLLVWCCCVDLFPIGAFCIYMCTSPPEHTSCWQRRQEGQAMALGVRGGFTSSPCTALPCKRDTAAAFSHCNQRGTVWISGRRGTEKNLPEYSQRMIGPFASVHEAQALWTRLHRGVERKARAFDLPKVTRQTVTGLEWAKVSRFPATHRYFNINCDTDMPGHGSSHCLVCGCFT